MSHIGTLTPEISPEIRAIAARRQSLQDFRESGFELTVDLSASGYAPQHENKFTARQAGFHF